MAGLFDDAEVISTYTRAQALADGVLVSLPEALVKEAGFTCPIDLTAAAWADVVRWGQAEEDAKPQASGQEETGRAWDVLTMLRHGLAAHSKRTGEPHRYGDRVPFSLIRVPPTGRGLAPRKVTLHAYLGADEIGQATITVMQPHED